MPSAARTEGPRGVPETFAPYFALVLLDRKSNDSEDVRHFGTLWFESNGLFVGREKDKWEQEIDYAWEQEGEPPANVLFAVGGGDCEEGADIYEAVEDEGKPLNRGFGVHEDFLTGF